MCHQVTLQPQCSHLVALVVDPLALEAQAVSWMEVVDIKPWAREKRSRDVV
jgi:hypothetical protein